MVRPVPLAPGLWISGQISPSEIAELARTLGLARIINNRPDGEEPDQPTSDALAEAARTAGLDYHALPVRGLPSADLVQDAVERIDPAVPTLMFCRSGMRSTALWAMAERGRGAAADDLRDRALAAGYDISGVPL